MADTFLETQKTQIEEVIVKLTDTILQLSSGAVQSYKLDTGQGAQAVTREDLSSLNKQLNSYLNMRDILCARTQGGGTFNIRPDCQ